MWSRALILDDQYVSSTWAENPASETKGFSDEKNEGFINVIKGRLLSPKLICPVNL